MIQTTFTCDVCGAVRGEGNHWLMMAAATELAGPMIYPWDDEIADGDVASDAKHICSAQCAHKALSLWLDKAHAASHAQESR